MRRAQIYAAKYLVSGIAPPIEGGAILCVSGKIAAVDTLAALKRQHPGLPVTDYPSGILLPLLINAHTHLELTDFPIWAHSNGQTQQPQKFIDWILNLIQVKKGLDQASYGQALKNGIEQSLAFGTGGVGDILAHHSARTAYAGTPLYGNLYLETLGQNPAVIRRLKKGLQQTLDHPFDAHLRLGVSPHSPYTISTTYLRYIYRLCQKRGLRCSTHVAESADEVDFTCDSRGDLAERFYPAINWQGFIPSPMKVRPVEYLSQQGGLFPENLLVHGVHLDPDDIELLGGKKMFLALCPRSNARLGVGRAPAAQLLKAGVRLALGTDSLASNDSLSVWDELAFAASWFDKDLDAPTLFHMATSTGAEALGIDHQLGSLSCAKHASFQVVHAPSELTAGGIYDYFTSGISQNDIMQICVEGELRLSGINQ